MKRTGWMLPVLACAVLALSPAWAAQEDTKGKPADGAYSYIIGPEDMLHVVVWKNESLSRVVQVRPDGMVSLPLINDTQAAGLTAMQLRDVLVKRFADYMPSPEISVIIQEVRSFKVSVLGEVQRPGRYDLRSRTTVLEALALAGGFRDFASPSRIVILRNDGSRASRIQFNFNRVIAEGGEKGNIELRPGDIVIVP